LHTGLEVRVGRVSLQHPVMNASGILAKDPDGALELLKAGVSAVVTKSFTREPREGHPTPIIVPLGYGYINSVGLSNPGLKGIRPIVETVKRRGKPVIVSIAAADVKEAEELAEEAVGAGADAIEVNLSCPHSRGRGLEVAYDEKLSAAIVEAVSSVAAGKTGVWVKLGLLDRLPDRVLGFIERGADAVVLINTVRAMVIDVYAKRPVLGGLVGGLSGRAVHPIAVRSVYDVYCETGVEIIGVGGVYTWRDAVELMLAGARAVQVGTALFDKGLHVVSEIVEGLGEYMRSEDFKSVTDLVGAACRR